MLKKEHRRFQSKVRLGLQLKLHLRGENAQEHDKSDGFDVAFDGALDGAIVSAIEDAL